VGERIGADAVPESAGVGKVLVVEDNPDVAAVTSALLEQLGYETLVAHSADAALELLDKGETCDLVFSDIVMAGAMDGLGLARALKERLPDMPVLLATGYTNAEEAARGDFSILRKPYQLGELGAAAARLIRLARSGPGEDNLVPFPKSRKGRQGQAQK